MLRRSKRQQKVPQSHVDYRAAAAVKRSKSKVPARVESPRTVVPPNPSQSNITPDITLASIIIPTSTQTMSQDMVAPGQSTVPSIPSVVSSTVVLQAPLGNLVDPISVTIANDDISMHVSHANKEKILSGQYIDLAVLLQNSNTIDNSNASNQQNVTIVDGKLLIQPKQNRKISSIEQWTDAFLSGFHQYIL